MSHTQTMIAAVLLLAAAHASAVSLSGDSLWLFNSANESVSLSMAVHDVSLDAAKVFGVPPVVQDPSSWPVALAPGSSVVLVGTVGDNPWIAQIAAAWPNCTSQWEAHCVVAVPAASSPLGVDTIACIGDGNRGAMFALYALSETVLGVDPYWWFMERPPTFVGPEASLPVATVEYPSPAFQYRALFTNDEDLFANWKPSPTGDAVWSLDTFDAFFQTALRIKANTFLVGTNPFPDERSVLLAARRGLTIIHHHYNLLGSNVFQWPLGSNGWSYQTDPQAMSHMWNASIAAQQSYDMIWCVSVKTTSRCRDHHSVSGPTVHTS